MQTKFIFILATFVAYPEDYQWKKINNLSREELDNSFNHEVIDENINWTKCCPKTGKSIRSHLDKLCKYSGTEENPCSRYQAIFVTKQLLGDKNGGCM